MPHSMELLSPKHLARWRAFYIAKSSAGVSFNLVELVDRMLATFFYERTACARQALQDLASFQVTIKKELGRLQKTVHGTQQEATVMTMPYQGHQFILDGQEPGLPCHGFTEPLEDPLESLEDLLAYRRDILAYQRRVERALVVHDKRLTEAPAWFAEMRPALVHSMLVHVADLTGEANTVLIAMQPPAVVAAAPAAAEAAPAPAAGEPVAAPPVVQEGTGSVSVAGWRGAGLRMLNSVIARLSPAVQR